MMSLKRDKKSTIKAFLLALIAGSIAPLSLSPFNFWPIALASVFVLLFALESTPKAFAAKLGWVYGLGFFGVGASWVFVSINVYGNASGLFAGFLTLLFVAGLALLFALQCYLYQGFFSGTHRALGFAATWVLFEWLRSWLLTGFPWLYLGYAHLGTSLANIAPVLGVMGVSFIVVLIAGLLYEIFLLWRKQNRFRIRQISLYAVFFFLLGSTNVLLEKVRWVKEVPERFADVALVQANIDQNLKFNPSYIRESMNLYDGLSAPLWQNDIVIWPETAIPMLYQSASAELAFFGNRAKDNNSSLISGILYREDDQIFNSITAIGNGSGTYHKQKLVPFGEYVPLANLLGPVLKIFSLPMSSLSSGPENQSLLLASAYQLAPYICYEVVYPDFVRKNAHEADFLVTISNDTWFGASAGPLQHLQMAAMRALENGRYMVRATSNGVTAFINERGQIISQTEQFEIATLSANIPAFTGRTPFSYWGSWPILIFSFITMLVIFFIRKKELES